MSVRRGDGSDEAERAFFSSAPPAPDPIGEPERLESEVAGAELEALARAAIEANTVALGLLSQRKLTFGERQRWQAAKAANDKLCRHLDALASKRTGTGATR